MITSSETAHIEGAYQEKKYIEYQPLDPSNEDFDELDEVIKIRGFQLSVPEGLTELQNISN